MTTQCDKITYQWYWIVFWVHPRRPEGGCLVLQDSGWMFGSWVVGWPPVGQWRWEMGCSRMRTRWQMLRDFLVHGSQWYPNWQWSGLVQTIVCCVCLRKGGRGDKWYYIYQSVSIPDGFKVVDILQASTGGYKAVIGLEVQPRCLIEYLPSVCISWLHLTKLVLNMASLPSNCLYWNLQDAIPPCGLSVPLTHPLIVVQYQRKLDIACSILASFPGPGNEASSIHKGIKSWSWLMKPCR